MNNTTTVLGEKNVKKYIKKVEDGFYDLCEDYYDALKIREKQFPTGNFLKLSPCIEKAMRKAEKLHRGQFRKGPIPKKIPYICHPFSVAGIVAQHTKNENAIIAAILHDTVEDCGYTFKQIENDFGKKVANIVQEVTEDISLKEKMGPSKSWKSRKKKYLENLKTAPKEALLVACADKIHNLNSLICNYKIEGKKMMKQFHSPFDDHLWFYRENLKIFKKRLNNKMVNKLEKTYQKARKIFS